MKSNFINYRTILIFLSIVIFGCKTPAKKNTDPSMSNKKYRPAYHFTPDKNWMNDPNGMFYYEGEYHLFYQHNPFGNTWGHMSWGHAVSKDLVRWEHLPLALAEENDVMIFSGSAVVDWNNSSGFGKDNEPPLVAIYTGHEEENKKQYQSVAYSNDKGRTWTKYSENPVLDIGMKDFRDPKVFWYEPDQKWVMIVALSLERKLHLYSSKDLKEWFYLSEFGPQNAIKGIWECPDLFEMKADDGQSKWVLGINLGRHSAAGGSGGQYLIGSFDGTEFVADKNSISKEKEYRSLSPLLASTTPSNNSKVLSSKTQTLLSEKFFSLNRTKDTFISKPFTLSADYLNFSLASLAPSEEFAPEITLWVDDQLIRNSTNNELNIVEWKAWNVEAYVGKTAELRIKKPADDSEISIIIDQIHLSNEAAYSLTENTQWMDYGTDFYAAVSWNDIPKEDGRRIWIGWMNNWHYANQIPSGEWRSSMSIARSLELIKKNDRYELLQHPVEELQKYRTSIFESKETDINTFNAQLEKLNISDQFEAVLEIDLKNTKHIKMFFGDTLHPAILWEYDNQNKMISTERLADGNEYFHPKFSNHQQFKVDTEFGILKIRLFVDKNSLEIFHQNGATVSTQLMYPISDSFKWKIISDNRHTKINKIEIFKLK